MDEYIWVEHHTAEGIVCLNIRLTFFNLSFHIAKCEDGRAIIVNPIGLSENLTDIYFIDVDAAKRECYRQIKECGEILLAVKES